MCQKFFEFFEKISERNENDKYDIIIAKNVNKSIDSTQGQKISDTQSKNQVSLIFC